ncbi:MAG: hypothetical protein ACYS19_01510 [Planctomycetota bacterium]
MFGKKRNKKVGLCLIVVTASLVLAAIWVVLATPQLSLADHRPGHRGDGGKGPGGKEHTQDIPVTVEIFDRSPGVSSDGGGNPPGSYTDRKKDHISTFVGRNSGQFILNTNTNDSDGGRTLVLEFGKPIEELSGYYAPEHLFDLGANGGTVTPVGAKISTARAPEVKTGYVDLRAMGVGEIADIALRIRLVVTDIQNAYDLNYRDVAWDKDDPSHPNPNMDKTDYVTVERLDDEDGKKQWRIESGQPTADYPDKGHRAYLCRIVNNDYNWIPVGIFDMPLSLTITEK